MRLQHRHRRTHLMILSRVQQQHEVTVRKPCCEILQKPKTQKKGTSFRHRETGCETCQCGWRSSQKNLEDEGVLASRGTPLTLIRIEIRNVLPRDRNCEIRKRTKITRAPCRKRTGDAVPRAENFGDMITSDHKVLHEGGESRHNHRYAAVVQDLDTQWIQSDPCKTKTSQEMEGSLRKFLEPSE